MLPIPATALLTPNLIKYILLGGIVIGGGLILSHALHSADQAQAQNSLDSSPEAQQANDLLKLLHPVTFKQFSTLDTLFHPLTALDALHDKLAIVDKEAIVSIGQGIANLTLVGSNYKKLTKDSLTLTDDLRATLNADQLKRFYQWINIKTNSAEKKQTTAFYIYAAPTSGQKYTAIYEDHLLKKQLVSYPAGAKMGKVSKLVTVPLQGSDGVIRPLQLYYLTMEIGKYKGKSIYVLVSQVSKKKS